MNLKLIFTFLILALPAWAVTPIEIVTTTGTQTITHKEVASGSLTGVTTVSGTISGNVTRSGITAGGAYTSPAITTPTGIVKGDVGLGNVDNTSDANKPVSTAQAAAITAGTASTISGTIPISQVTNLPTLLATGTTALTDAAAAQATANAALPAATFATGSAAIVAQIPTNNTQLTNGAGYQTISGTVAALVSTILPPTLVTTGSLRLLLDETSLTGTNNSAVSSWSDVSGNANHAVQATGTSQPTMLTNAINGFPAVHTNGTNGFLAAPVTSSTSWTDMTVVAVCHGVSSNASASYNPYISISGTSADNTTIYTAGGWYIGEANYPASNGLRAPELIFKPAAGNYRRVVSDPGEWAVVAYQLSGSTINVYWNGNLLQSIGTTGAASLQLTGTLMIGRLPGSFFGSVDIASLAVYSGKVSDTEVANLNNWFLNKYNLGQKPQIAFIGESITQAGSDYPQQTMVAMGGVESWDTFISGWAGFNLSQITPLWQPSINQLATHSGRKPVVCLEVGYNEISDGVTTGTTAFNRMVSACQTIKSQRDCKIVLLTPGPLCLVASNIRDAVDAQRQVLCTLIRSGTTGTQTWDAVADIAADPTVGTYASGSNATYYPDGQHPGIAATAIWGPIVATAINSVSGNQSVPVFTGTQYAVGDARWAAVSSISTLSTAQMTSGSAAWATVYESRLTADAAAVSSNTTPQSSGLSVTLPVGEYRVQAMAVTVGTNYAVCGSKLQITFGGTASNTYNLFRQATSAANYPWGSLTFSTYAESQAYENYGVFSAKSSNNTNQVAMWDAHITVTVSGALELKYAQQTSSGTGVSLGASSYIMATRVH